tara:strand:- start:989 stop:2056 length:1068 start_codon:yes stop_codon:yes gene_type:complete
MNVFCYFVEPASYTLDLASNVYSSYKINYCFIKSHSLAFSHSNSNKIFLDKLSFFKKLHFIFLSFKNNDVIIINGYNNYPFIVIFMLNLFSIKKKSIAIDSDTQLNIPSNPFKRFFKWVYLSFVFQNKYVLGFAGGSAIHKDLFRYYGMKENRIFLMPMVVDNQKYYLDNKQFPETFTFLFVGRLIPSKNVDALCEQFIHYFSEKDVRLIVVGDGESRSDLQKKYSHPRIQFKGSVFGEDLVKLYHNSSVFLFPSLFDAWGLVINEALSSGLPVITHKSVGANYDLVKGKNTGLIASNINEFGEQMLELYNNHNLLMTYSKKALYLMKNHWNYNLYAECLNKALKKCEKDMNITL